MSGTTRRPENSKRSRPCDACRRRKSKCVTEEGNTICVLCKFHDQQCTYLEAPQPRKRAANTGSLPDTQPPKRSRVFQTRPGTGIEEHTLPGHSLLTRTLGLQNHRHTQYVGPNAIPDVYGIPNLQDSDVQDGDTAMEFVRFVHPSAAFRVIPDTETTGYEEERPAIDEIEATAGGHGPDLIQLYFRIIHPSFPVLHKAVFIEKYSRSYREFAPPLLASVYLLSSAYWNYSDSLAASNPIDASTLQGLAFKALHNTMRRPKLSTIQAGLLLSQYQKAFMGTNPHEQRDHLTVQLVNIAHGIGLHLDCSTWDIPDWEVGLRRRIGWALYMQDKWSALLESRPSLISPDEWDIEELLEEDFPETDEDEQEGSSEVQRGRLVFMHMADLSVILSDILRDVFSSRARRAIENAPDKLLSTLEQMKPVQIKLKDWSLTLPEALKMESVPAMKLCSVGYLRMALLGVEVCLYRNLLRTFLTAEWSDPALVQVCRSAAAERFISATDFVHRLQAQHLASFWYFTAAKCCALTYSLGLMLDVTAQISEEKAMYATKLRAFKWALKVNGEAGASFMRQALAFINQPVRIATQSLDNASTIASTIATPRSVELFGPGGNMPETSPQQQPPQWFPQQPMQANYPFANLEQPILPTDPAMLNFYQGEFDGNWMPNIR